MIDESPAKEEGEQGRNAPNAKSVKRKLINEPAPVAKKVAAPAAKKVAAPAGAKAVTNSTSATNAIANCNDVILDHEIELDDENMTKANAIRTSFVAFKCRSVRVGSYKVGPEKEAKFTRKGFQLSLPNLKDGNRQYFDIYTLRL